MRDKKGNPLADILCVVFKILFEADKLRFYDVIIFNL